jgi:hypothetical protein
MPMDVKEFCEIWRQKTEDEMNKTYERTLIDESQVPTFDIGPILPHIERWRLGPIEISSGKSVGALPPFFYSSSCLPADGILRMASRFPGRI